MNKLLLSLLLLCVAQLSAQSRFKTTSRYFEAGFMFGLANYSGDMAEKTIRLSETHFGYGAYGRYFFSNKLAVRLHLFSTSISGDDANAKNPNTLRRSFRFSTDVLELGLCGEWHFLRKEQYSNTRQYLFSPYIYLGLGGTFSNAEAEYYGTPEDRIMFLKVPFPEVDERQKFWIAPVGFGVRVDLNEALVLGLEGGCRPVFSDKLDGVRLNGNPDKNDWYYFGGATLSFILNRPKKVL